MGLIKASDWKDIGLKVHNSEKKLFLKLVNRCIRKGNSQKDCYGMMDSGKAIIMTRMCLETNGLLKVTKLTLKLHANVEKQILVFDAAQYPSIAT